VIWFSIKYFSEFGTRWETSQVRDTGGNIDGRNWHVDMLIDMLAVVLMADTWPSASAANVAPKSRA